MIKVIPAADRHYNDFGWLKTYWLFSFDTYHDPKNMNFGSLRVFNDDVVEAGAGFPTHAHAEMEIITIVLSGAVTHSDSMGNKGVIRAGDVQRMTAGTGIRHSEFNFGDEPLHLYQIWIMPDKSGLSPSYEQRTTQIADYKNRLLPVASGQTIDGAVHLNTDAAIYLSALEAGTPVQHASLGKQRLFIYVTEGEIDVNGVTIRKNDQGRVEGEDALELKAATDSRFILVEVQ